MRLGPRSHRIRRQTNLNGSVSVIAERFSTARMASRAVPIARIFNAAEEAHWMSKHLYWLDDASWSAIEPLLPRGRRGAHRVDDRRVISGIMHMLKTGARWRDCPADYGPYTTIYNRFNRWS